MLSLRDVYYKFREETIGAEGDSWIRAIELGV